MTNSSLQEIVCGLAQPAAGNPIQFMVEKAFRAAGIDWQYLTLEVGPHQLEDAIRGIRAMGLRGAAIGVPHKTTVMQHLDQLTDDARLIKGVNWVFRQEDQWIGDNTHGAAFERALREIIDPGQRNVVILGAGVVARSAALKLAQAGASQITVVSRSLDRGQQLVDEITEELHVPARLVIWNNTYEIEATAEILVHATSMAGLDPHQNVLIEPKSLHNKLVVVDLTFNPSQTQLLAKASAQGCTTIDGLSTFVHHVAIGFQRWTEIEPDRALMREALEEFLGF